MGDLKVEPFVCVSEDSKGVLRAHFSTAVDLLNPDGTPNGYGRGAEAKDGKRLGNNTYARTEEHLEDSVETHKKMVAGELPALLGEENARLQGEEYQEGLDAVRESKEAGLPTPECKFLSM